MTTYKLYNVDIEETELPASAPIGAEAYRLIHFTHEPVGTLFYEFYVAKVEVEDEYADPENGPEPLHTVLGDWKMESGGIGRNTMDEVVERYNSEKPVLELSPEAKAKLREELVKANPHTFSCGCGSFARHTHDGKGCCGGEMCCANANE